jgi:hypothetical protein
MNDFPALKAALLLDPPPCAHPGPGFPGRG